MPFPLYKQLLEINATISSVVAPLCNRSSRTQLNSRQWFFSILSKNIFGGKDPDANEGLDLFHVGLRLFETLGSPEEDGYDSCTPTNSRVFGQTGCGGTHFSFLTDTGMVNEQTPVIVTLPSNLGRSVIVGENFHDFLCLGCLRGFYGIEHIDSSLRRNFNMIDFVPTEEDAGYGFETNPEKEAILMYLRTELNLKPWSDVDNHFQDLQTRFEELIQYPEGLWE